MFPSLAKTLRKESVGLFFHCNADMVLDIFYICSCMFQVAE